MTSWCNRAKCLINRLPMSRMRVLVCSLSSACCVVRARALFQYICNPALYVRNGATIACDLFQDPQPPIILTEICCTSTSTT
ncbi:hypothetical protein BD289DRAFT_97120 [Coniella lustricola]|uniref:Uncharacterized protein n=1 Tax=Coniella lustricola TaxID=2025994 RepID=A0A2T3AMZ8_9PEZI|nr:hypothetical protein BD289DRAFT_97120 [Coniella lustricola]